MGKEGVHNRVKACLIAAYSCQYYMDDDLAGVGKTTVTSGTRHHATIVPFSETCKCIQVNIPLVRIPLF